MGKNDPIFCFNGSECVYAKCGMFDDTVSICGIERLKTAKVWEAGRGALAPQMSPSERAAQAGRVQQGQTSFTSSSQQQPDMERLIQEEMAKASGLLTRETAEYLVKQSFENKKRILDANKKPFTNCADVEDQMKSIRVHGKLVDDPVSVELNTRKGPMTVIKAILDDGTSQLRITFWDINKIPIMKAGNEVTVDGLLGSAPYDGLPQASGSKYTKVIFEKV